ncbi:ATP-dependent protease ATPase subunit HslU [Candidatus Xenohaliotis californiensis]|uniref:ATP-dependent protease ATPase subunit HslU n=1 Tax=Candidatus Xenohaliotis californiensis TaxID=84677 RepID=A0ABM9N972_9RICK|nr:ATP-dependent protease ATPase subunit HslU [Candidatus Xenohaliotis californiensis]
MNNDVPNPKKIVEELDKHIVGQHDAKKIVAIALRNRWRRNQIKTGMQAEIIPKNILMIGPTGVGKTEIARRLSRMVNAPFIKVEATKFTEVGYVGRDVDSIIRDLLDIAINLKREERRKHVIKRAERTAKARIIKILSNDSQEKLAKCEQELESGALDNKEIEVELEATDSNYNSLDVPDMPGAGVGIINITDMIGKTLGNKNKKKRCMKIKHAYEALKIEESDKLIDQDQIIKDAIDSTENSGIVFLDEVDKITPKSDARSEVNREGVQRDLLPLIEGTVVNTKYGSVKTNYVLFIASGAFHLSKPSDLLPELQGRLPVRVELNSLKCEDYIKILTDPQYSLLKQYIALMKTEKVDLVFTASGTKKIAKYAFELNNEIENIGARRLNTIMEKLLEDISFNTDEAANSMVKITESYVTEKLNKIITTLDLSKFIL